MGAEHTRARRSTLVSAGLHALLFGLAWWWAGPGEDSVSLVLGDLPPGAPRFEAPAALPVEFVQRQTLEAHEPWPEPSPDPDAPQRALPGSEPESEPRDQAGRGKADSPAREGPSEPHTEDFEPPTPKAGSLLDARGLAGAGRGEPGSAPSLLGSRAAYADSSSLPPGRDEGPRRPTSAERAGDYVFEREGSEWVYRDPGGSITATLQEDGGVVFRNRLIRVRPELSPSIANNGEAFLTVVIEYDPVGIARKAAGRDPYPRAKALLLRATFEERLELARTYHKRQMILRLGELDEDLERIWARKGLPLAERKRLLFERWDGCVEATESDTGFRNEEAVEALDQIREQLAPAARRKVIRFINEVAPPGSDAAYTEGELAELNAKRVSRERFAPYG